MYNIHILTKFILIEGLVCFTLSAVLSISYVPSFAKDSTNAKNVEVDTSITTTSHEGYTLKWNGKGIRVLESVVVDGTSYSYKYDSDRNRLSKNNICSIKRYSCSLFFNKYSEKFHFFKRLKK